MPEPAAMSEPAEPLELLLTSGRRLRIPARFDEQALIPAFVFGVRDGAVWKFFSHQIDGPKDRIIQKAAPLPVIPVGW